MGGLELVSPVYLTVHLMLLRVCRSGMVYDIAECEWINSLALAEICDEVGIGDGDIPEMVMPE